MIGKYRILLLSFMSDRSFYHFVDPIAVQLVVSTELLIVAVSDLELLHCTLARHVDCVERADQLVLDLR